MRNALLILIVSALGLNAQNQSLKFMSYNLMYYRASGAPCTPSQGPTARDQELANVFHFVKPTIFTVNELGSGASTASFLVNNVLNTNGETNYDKALSTNHPTSPSSIVNMLFFDSTKVGLHSQDYLDKELDGSTRIVRVIDFYRMYFKDPKLSQGADTVFFTVVLAHLKASSGSADKAERGEAAKAIMKHLTDNVQDENVILCGDLNLYSNSEQAFQQFTNYQVATEKFYDPINQIGAWSGNNTYTQWHTQSTHASGSGCHVGGGLDDRFDFFLISDALRSGDAGMKYKLNSYEVIGNDGGHFNQSINAGTNTSAPSSIITSLYNMSDHLPIVMDVEVELSDLSVNEYDAARFTYTNPVADVCKLQSKASNENREVVLIALTGKTMATKTWPANTSNTSIDLSQVPTGVYILSVKQNNRTIRSVKIIKN